ncbi:UNC93-like protein MFSD11 [Paramacrobiotus metropolitanus]|uniref:UNC93-like protein MFSD11 n=1 Tax=Paramacrobiotus metropolitanus TaxID=2943436 RepID=UPI0024463074|nr:UNC93-like protein MFSD11 [Paramacrobiotus metropolitanus]
MWEPVSDNNAPGPSSPPEEAAFASVPQKTYTEVDYINFRSAEHDGRYNELTESIRSNPESDIASRYSDRLSKRSILCIRVSFLNILLMGFRFMFNIGAYTTAGMAQTVVLNSVNDDYFQGTPTLGYVLWAVCCGTQALAYLFGPCVVAVIGPKTAMVSGAACVSLYIACFIRPLTIALYIGAALMGFGVGIIWVVQQHFITINSTSKRVMRNTGVFWGLYQSSLVTGNMFYFIMVHGAEQIDTETRLIVFGTLTGISGIGIVVFALLVHPWCEKVRRPPHEYLTLSQNGAEPVPHRSAKEALVATLKVAKNRDMLILMPIFCYIGVEGTFWVNVYGTSLGYTERFGTLRESLVGLTGVFAGAGEIIGGLLLGFLGKWMHYNGKDGMLMFAMVVHVAAYYLTFLNTPSSASLGMTDDGAYVDPDPYIAMVVAFLLGLGDAIFNSQCMAYLGHVYRHDCVSVFGVYQFWCAIANCISFLYATILTIPYQLLILVINAVMAAAGFCYVEWQAYRTHPPE